MHPLDTYFRLRDERTARFAERYTELTIQFEALQREESQLVRGQEDARAEVYKQLAGRGQDLLKHPKIWAEIQTFIADMAGIEPKQFEENKDHLQGEFWFLLHLPFDVSIFDFTEIPYIDRGTTTERYTFSTDVFQAARWIIGWEDWDSYDSFFYAIRRGMTFQPLYSVVKARESVFEALLQAYPGELRVRMAKDPKQCLAHILYDELICLFWGAIWFDQYLPAKPSEIPYHHYHHL